MTTHRYTPSTGELTHAIIRDGVEPHRSLLASLGQSAEALGLRSGATQALIDARSPDVVLERAFALVARALGRSGVSTGARFVVAA